VAETTVDESVKNAEPVAVWCDKNGKFKDKGSTYALVRMKRTNVEQRVKEKIK